jgi:nicotinamide riboside transporter PnuC
LCSGIISKILLEYWIPTNIISIYNWRTWGRDNKAPVHSAAAVLKPRTPCVNSLSLFITE